jgi:hypothetical protein
VRVIFALLYFLLLALLACAPDQDLTRHLPSPGPTATPSIINEIKTPKMSWDSGHPEREAWSKKIYSLVIGDLFINFDMAKDAKRICKKYESLGVGDRARVWSEFIIAMAYFESGWLPTSRMQEPQGSFPAPDPITKRPVFSEGLLQLSYQDVKSHPYCNGFNWQKDKLLRADDPRKTILNPEINLDCGVKILARQIKSRGTAIVKTKYYWSVIQEGGKYSKVDQIINKVKFYIPGC